VLPKCYLPAIALKAWDSFCHSPCIITPATVISDPVKFYTSNSGRFNLHAGVGICSADMLVMVFNRN
jgi:hypothetical protein